MLVQLSPDPVELQRLGAANDHAVFSLNYYELGGRHLQELSI